MPELHFMLPGDPASATGGYEYDRQVIAGLRRLGWQVQLHCLDSSFPQPSAAALADAGRQLASLPEDACVLIDGLALGAMPEVVRDHEQRLRLMALIHHPLADETGVTPHEAQWLREAERAALQSVRFVITTGQAMVNALSAYVSDRRRIGVVAPGVRRSELDRDAAVRLAGEATAALQVVAAGEAGEAGVPGCNAQMANDIRLLCVATITPRKGHASLVEALAGLQHLPWHLECVGDTSRSPETFQSLQRLVDHHGLQSRINFTGVLDDDALQTRWAQAEIFVLATQFEGYGMAVADALVHGVPVISTHTGEIASLVGEDAGVLIPPGDVAELRAALSALISGQQLRQRMAAAASRRGAALPDWNMASQQLAGLLIQGAGLPTIGEAA